MHVRRRAVVAAGFFLAAVCAGVLLLANSGGLRATNGNFVALIDPAGYGEGSSVAIGTDGLPIIGYNWHNIQTQESHFKVAHCGTADCSSGNIVTTINNLGGSQAFVVIGSDGLPIISFLSQGLTVVHCGNVVCNAGNTITVVDSATSVGAASSMSIGSDGLPLISYGGYYPNSGLRVAHCSNVACTSATINIVDSAGGLGTSLTFGTDGLPLISHLAQGASLRVTHCGDATCTPASASTVDLGYASSGPTSLAIGSDSLPVISYTTYASQLLLTLVHCGNGTCTSGNTTTNVAPAGGNGQFYSLVIGPNGFPLIAGNYGELRLIRCGSVDCSTGNVSGNLTVSGTQKTAIAIGSDGFPVMTYGYGVEMRSLHCGDPACGLLKPTPTPLATPTPSGHDPAVTALSVPTWPVPPIATKKVSGTVRNLGTLTSSYTITLRVNYGFDYTASWVGQSGDTVQNGLFCSGTCTEPFYSLLTYNVLALPPAGTVTVSRNLSVGCPSPVNVVPKTITVGLTASDLTGLDDNPVNSTMSASRSVHCLVSQPTPVPVGGITELANAGPSSAR